MIDSRGAADQPVRFNGRTWRGVLAQIGVVAALACLLDLEFALGLGWTDWALVVGPIVFLLLLLFMLAGNTEWTVAGHELRRRRWLSRSGLEPSLVMELGPQIEIVHETRLLWRVRPNGLALGGWYARRLIGAMERAGVRVNDWRGDWAQRHRLLDTLGGLALYGGLAGMIVMPILGSNWSLFRATAGLACSGAVLLGLAVDYLPWSMRKTPAYDGWPPLSAGARGGAWNLQTQVGPAPGLAFGGFWLRVVAYLIDMSLLGIVGTVLSLALGTAGQAMSALIFIAYFVGLWGTRGQTIGMMLLGLHVVRDADGGKITWGNAVLRFVGLFVAFACIYVGVIWVAFDSRKRGWHDKIGGTVVVRNVVDGSADATRPLNVRQAATAGIIVSFVSFVAAAAGAAAGPSTTRLQTFVLVLAVQLTVTVGITAVALAIYRRAGRPRDL